MKKLATALLAVAAAAACDSTPRERFVQWVARDAWDEKCAEKAMIEVWKQENPRWKVEGQVWVVDVDAKFRMVDDCQSGLPLVGKAYKALEVVPFKKQGLEVSQCARGGDKGWSQPGREGTRCWTGPTLLPADAAKK